MQNDILICDVCGTTSNEATINVHSAMNIPVSLSYCEYCDKKGYITFYELIKFMSNPKKKEWIVENIDFIIENCRAINKGLWSRKHNNEKKNN